MQQVEAIPELSESVLGLEPLGNLQEHPMVFIHPALSQNSSPNHTAPFPAKA